VINSISHNFPDHEAANSTLNSITVFPKLNPYSIAMEEGEPIMRYIIPKHANPPLRGTNIECNSYQPPALTLDGGGILP